MYEDMMEDARPLLPRIKASVTVLYAYDASMGQPASMVDNLYASAYADLSGAKLKRIDGGYHFIMLDQPEAFASEVDAFLK
jgi:pimeloyl-ACP methyl ester carboxylesterase